MSEIRFADGAAERAVLYKILNLDQLSLAGDIDEHVVITGDDGSILGGAMLSRWEDDAFHMEVFGIRSETRGKGHGRMLLEKLVAEPWNYCRRVYGMPNQEKPQDGSFVLTTVSRGEARGFYKVCGFEECDVSALPEYYHHQCPDCPEKAECNPAYMIYKK